jgi:hypothetical protein
VHSSRLRQPSLRNPKDGAKCRQERNAFSVLIRCDPRLRDLLHGVRRSRKSDATRPERTLARSREYSSKLADFLEVPLIVRILAVFVTSGPNRNPLRENQKRNEGMSTRKSLLKKPTTVGPSCTGEFARKIQLAAPPLRSLEAIQHR